MTDRLTSSRQRRTYNEEFWDCVRREYVDSAVRGEYISLQELSRRLDIPIRVLQQRASKERWAEQANIAYSSKRLVGHEASVLQPIISDEVSTYIKGSGLQAEIEGKAEVAVAKVVETKVRPYVEWVHYHLTQLEEQIGAVSRLWALVDHLPKTKAEAISEGWKARDYLTALKLAGELTQSTISAVRLLYGMPNTISQQMKVSVEADVSAAVSNAEPQKLIRTLERLGLRAGKESEDSEESGDTVIPEESGDTVIPGESGDTVIDVTVPGNNNDGWVEE